MPIFSPFLCTFHNIKISIYFFFNQTVLFSIQIYEKNICTDRKFYFLDPFINKMKERKKSVTKRVENNLKKIPPPEQRCKNRSGSVFSFLPSPPLPFLFFILRWIEIDDAARIRDSGKRGKIVQQFRPFSSVSSFSLLRLPPDTRPVFRAQLN